jgi:hypothetical protein
MSFIRNGLCAAVLCLSATASQALPVTVDFEVDLIGDIPGYLGAPGFGTLTYEDGDVIGTTGDITLTPTTGFLSFSMTLFAGEAYEQTFTLSDDYEYPDFPMLYFFDEELYGMDFVVDGGFTPIAAPGVGFVLANYDCFCGGDIFLNDGPNGENYLTVVVASVPVPAALPLMLGGIGLLGVAARRRKG